MDATCCAATEGTCGLCTCPSVLKGNDDCEERGSSQANKDLLSTIGFYYCNSSGENTVENGKLSGCWCDSTSTMKETGLPFGFNSAGTTEPRCTGPACCSSTSIEAGEAIDINGSANMASPAALLIVAASVGLGLALNVFM